MKIEVGDWISFCNNGTIVIGLVVYILKDSYKINFLNYYTTAGVVYENNVLEVRKPTK